MKLTAAMLRRLTYNRLDLAMSFLDDLFFDEKTRGQFLSDEGELNLKDQITRQINDLQLDVSLEILKNKLLLRPKVAKLYERILAAAQAPETEVVRLFEESLDLRKRLHSDLLKEVESLITQAENAYADVNFLNTRHYEQVLPVKQEIYIEEKFQAEALRILKNIASSDYSRLTLILHG